MNENYQASFLRALAANEDDEETRLVYADWLEEQGQHEEAVRQRQWTGAKAWLVAFCEENNPKLSDDDYLNDEGRQDPDQAIEMLHYYESLHISYQDLIELAREAVNDDPKEPQIFFGGNMDIMEALYEAREEFWKNWSIVTGIPLNDDIVNKSSFRCAC